MVFLLAALVVGGVSWYNRTNRSAPINEPVAQAFHGATFDLPNPAPDFSLNDYDGVPFRLSDHRGEVVVLFFGFTMCPDVCPATLAHYKQVKQHLGDDAANVKFVMISVDPERDTPERMKQYVQAFDPEFIGLTGTLAEAKVVWDKYEVKPEKIEIEGSALGYSVAHPASSYVVDRDGHLRLLHFYGLPSDAVAEDLRKLLS